MATALPESKRVKVELPADDSRDSSGWECFVEYVELPREASTATSATLVLLHGSPGSIAGFRYLLSPLADRTGGARVLALNLPGAGRSDMVSGDFYEYLTMPTAVRVVLRALEQLCNPEEQVFLVGHSFGGHVALRLANLASDNKTEGVRTLDVRGFALIAAVGLEPPRTYWPRGGGLLWWMLSHPWISSWGAVTQELARIGLTKVVGFPTGYPTSHYVAALARQATADYEIAEMCLKKLSRADQQNISGNASKMSAFVSWARNDRHIATSSSEQLAAISPAGPRLVFDRGGHNLQKTQAAALAKAIGQWIAARL